MKKFAIILIISIFCFLFMSCNWAVWKDDPIDYGSGQGNTNSGFLFSGTAPTSVYATKARFSDSIVVSWNSVNGADYYEVFKAEAESRNPNEEDLIWERMAVAPVGTSITDTDVETGKYYSYRVRGRSSSLLSVLGDYSEISTGWVLMPPSNLQASQGADTDYINLSWDTVDNVQGYRIEWSDNGYEGGWNTAIPEGMDAEDYVFPSSVGEFNFAPSNQYLGLSLYFRIRSISVAGDESSASGRKLGYTLVQGAPTAPTNFVASKAASATAIELSWDYMKDEIHDKDYDWEIYRSAVGSNSSELLIFSTLEGDPLPSVSGSTMTYTDTRNLSAGVEYKYTIRAIGEVDRADGSTIKANGLPSEDTGYLLSPPSVTNMEIVTSPSVGFRFTVEKPLGGEDHPEWRYRVYGANASSGPWHFLTEVTGDDLEVFSPFITSSASATARTVSIEANSYEYFSTTTVTDDGTESAQLQNTPINDNQPISFARPSAASGYNVTDNLLASGMSVSNGVYQIAATMDRDPLVEYYNVRIWHSEPASVNTPADEERTEIRPESYGDVGDAVILKDIASPGFGTRYWVAVQGVDTIGREGEWSRVDSGYGAITGATLIRIMQAYGLKPWESIDTSLLTQWPGSAELNQRWKDSGIYDKVAQAGTGSLGSVTQESITGDGGTISYNAVISGLGGRVTFSYRNFGEVDFLKISGNYVMDVDMGGTGSCTGAITVSGWYPATIGFDNISVSSQKFVGSYTVTQTGRESEEVSPNQ